MFDIGDSFLILTCTIIVMAPAYIALYFISCFWRAWNIAKIIATGKSIIQLILAGHFIASDVEHHPGDIRDVVLENYIKISEDGIELEETPEQIETASIPEIKVLNEKYQTMIDEKLMRLIVEHFLTEMIYTGQMASVADFIGIDPQQVLGKTREEINQRIQKCQRTTSHISHILLKNKFIGSLILDGYRASSR